MVIEGFIRNASYNLEGHLKVLLKYLTMYTDHYPYTVSVFKIIEFAGFLHMPDCPDENLMH